MTSDERDRIVARMQTMRADRAAPKPRTFARIARKYADPRPAPPGSFCANVTSTCSRDVRLEYGWRDDGGAMRICTTCSTVPASGTASGQTRRAR